ncbi:MAG: hypothetical protein JWM11_6676 [Planctomycetaceae bacterium]|nr:hypothetical protein [Planctomycetaceae bacterium]
MCEIEKVSAARMAQTCSNPRLRTISVGNAAPNELRVTKNASGNWTAFSKNPKTGKLLFDCVNANDMLKHRDVKCIEGPPENCRCCPS